MIIEITLNKHNQDDSYLEGSDITVKVQLAYHSVLIAEDQLTNMSGFEWVIYKMSALGIKDDVWHGWGITLIDGAVHTEDKVLELK